MYEDQESEDEGLVLRSRVNSLKHVALEISDVLRTQNKDLQNLQPGFENKLYQILSNVKLIKNIKPQYFKTWLYYIGGTLLILFLFLILFVFS
ncbi:uncharacterized protein VNE69_06227 [Vairimorpha necatrix]|uniref:Membrane protein n=1 Tax=Vairimorpha necatrix TaxID=6039 RepID=A0AAX4JD80_9MICR